MRLKYKILLGYLILSSTVLFTYVLGAKTFRRLESRHQQLNNFFVPALKMLGQIDSTFFLLETDLDKSIQEGIFRSTESMESVVSSRLNHLSSYESSNVQSWEEKFRTLSSSFSDFRAAASALAADWTNRVGHLEKISKARLDFRQKLSTTTGAMDSETRLVALELQAETSRLGIFLTSVFACCVIVALLLVYWSIWSLRPLEQLAGVMRDISKAGIDHTAVQSLAQLPLKADEVGQLTRETLKMANSLLDNDRLLRDQRANLESAHASLARQNNELKAAQEKLIHSEKLSAIGQMAAQMAHEIRNPLNALNLHVEIMEEDLRKSKTESESLGFVRKEINRLIGLTEQYLDLTRGLKLERESVSLNLVVEEVHDLFLPLAREKGIAFTCDLTATQAVRANHRQMIQVLSNLVKNAIEALEESERTGKYIRILTEESDGKVVLSVIDNGSGVPTNIRTRIFSPFQSSKATGTGLGLAYSKEILVAHGGDIDFESVEGRGSKFMINLPV